VRRQQQSAEAHRAPSAVASLPRSRADPVLGARARVTVVNAAKHATHAAAHGCAPARTLLLPCPLHALSVLLQSTRAHCCALAQTHLRADHVGLRRLLVPCCLVTQVQVFHALQHPS
jgi:hypothetical protein